MRTIAKEIIEAMLIRKSLVLESQSECLTVCSLNQKQTQKHSSAEKFPVKYTVALFELQFRSVA